jgi:hypothetical protein
MAKSSRSISARVLGESHFGLQRIQAARYEVFLQLTIFKKRTATISRSAERDG